MAVWKFEMCPQCGGDIVVDQDMNGWYEQCKHCSYRNDLKSTAELKRALIPKKQGVSLKEKAEYCLHLPDYQYALSRDEPVSVRVILVNVTSEIPARAFSLN